MLPEKQLCSQCGSDDMVMNGRFGSGGTWVCRECGTADVSLDSEPGEDEDLEVGMSIKKSKLLSSNSSDESDEFESSEDLSTNLIKANRTKVIKSGKVSKGSKNVKITKNVKSGNLTKGRKKK